MLQIKKILRPLQSDYRGQMTVHEHVIRKQTQEA